MTDPAASSVLATQITFSALWVAAMQIAKKVKWIPINEDTADSVKRVLTVIASGLVAAGIHGTYTWNPQTRIFSPNIHIPTLTTALFGLGHWVRSYVFTEGTYQTYKFGKFMKYLPKVVEILENQDGKGKS